MHPMSLARRAVAIEPLEERMLFSGITKIKGSFTGFYIDPGGKHPDSMQVLKSTHTGHFSGTATFENSGRTINATFSGKITSTRHVHIDFVATGGFSGTFITMTGIATATGGEIQGSFVVSGKVSDAGTFKFFKP